MADEWSPVFEHDGKGCPIAYGTYVRAFFENGDVREGILRDTGFRPVNGGCWHWTFARANGYSPIIRYQIRRPPSVQKMIDKAEGLPVKHRERVDDDAYLASIGL